MLVHRLDAREAEQCEEMGSSSRQGMPEAVFGENFGHNRLKSYYLQVQPVTCSHPPVFLC